MKLTDLSNEELVTGLHRVVSAGRIVLVELLAYLAEVEARELHLAAACSSMFVYCVERLGMSEGEAKRRLSVARAARQYPMIVDAIARGDLSLTNVALLHEHLTPENHDQVLRAAFKKKKIQVLELIASLRPRPDVPSLISPLPSTAPRTVDRPGAPPPSAPAPSAVVEPLRPERYRLQVTIGTELRETIERAKDLMRHRNPSGDLEVLLDEAMKLLVAKLERERLAKTERPSKKEPKAKGISRAARREVFERDGMRCTFVDQHGHRCTATGFLELDHTHARGRGGSDDPTNLRVLCRAHNLWLAKQEYGAQNVEEQIHVRQRTSRWSTATSALKNLGFREADVKKAIGELKERHRDGDVALEHLVREGIAYLTA